MSNLDYLISPMKQSNKIYLESITKRQIHTSGSMEPQHNKDQNYSRFQSPPPQRFKYSNNQLDSNDSKPSSHNVIQQKVKHFQIKTDNFSKRGSAQQFNTNLESQNQIQLKTQGSLKINSSYLQLLANIKMQNIESELLSAGNQQQQENNLDTSITDSNMHSVCNNNEVICNIESVLQILPVILQKEIGKTDVTLKEIIYNLIYTIKTLGQGFLKQLNHLESVIDSLNSKLRKSSNNTAIQDHWKKQYESQQVYLVLLREQLAHHKKLKDYENELREEIKQLKNEQNSLVNTQIEQLNELYQNISMKKQQGNLFRCENCALNEQRVVDILQQNEEFRSQILSNDEYTDNLQQKINSHCLSFENQQNISRELLKKLESQLGSKMFEGSVVQNITKVVIFSYEIQAKINKQNVEDLEYFTRNMSIQDKLEYCINQLSQQNQLSFQYYLKKTQQEKENSEQQRLNQQLNEENRCNLPKQKIKQIRSGPKLSPGKFSQQNNSKEDINKLSASKTKFFKKPLTLQKKQQSPLKQLLFEKNN